MLGSMSNGITPSPQAAPTPVNVIGIMGAFNPAYPPSVTLGQGGYPPPETGPTALPPGSAPGLPTLVFGGAWQH
jgi:hypothetical protein